MSAIQAVNISIADDFSNVSELILSIRPKWKKTALKQKEFTTGITNKIMGFYCSNDPEWNDMILIRRYGEGTDKIIDRRAELRNIAVLNKYGLCPPGYFALNNGVVYGFEPGCTTDEVTIKSEEVYPLVAQTLAKIHSIDLSSEQGFSDTPYLFPKLESLFKSIPVAFSNSRNQEKFKESGLTLESLQQEVEGIREVVEKHAVPMFSFSHNDILLENVIYNEKEQRVTLIDYEYGEFNYSFYDIGNHFAEMIGVGKINPENYPGREFQAKWIRVYFTAKGMNDTELTEVFIKNMVDQAQMFSLCGHLFWGVWALFQAEYSKIDFDFMDYGLTKLKEFLNRKDEFLDFTNN